MRGLFNQVALLDDFRWVALPSPKRNELPWIWWARFNIAYHFVSFRPRV